MVKMSKKAQTAAKSLAVRYAAYQEARHAEDHTSVIIWGTALLMSQQETGIEIANTENIIALVERARKLESKGE